MWRGCRQRWDLDTSGGTCEAQRRRVEVQRRKDTRANLAKWVGKEEAAAAAAAEGEFT